MSEGMPVLAALAGTLAGSLTGILVACLPGFHVYSVLGLGFLLLSRPATGAAADAALAFTVAAVCAWSIASAIPAILLSAPDESAVFTVLPGQRYVMQGRGYEAIRLTAIGAACALAVVLPLGYLAAPLLPGVHRVLAPHYHWIVWVTMTFMVLSEWPQGRIAGLSRGRRLWHGLRNVTAGLATFLLSGLLGLILLTRSPLPPGVSVQNLMPAFAGLFAVPWLILNCVSRARLPPQSRADRALPPPGMLLHGCTAGIAGGSFAAFIPVVSGGIGGLLSGHAFSTRHEPTFLVSQGACRTVYAVGGLLLLFVPALAVSRGGAAAMLKVVHVSRPGDLVLALAAAAVSAAVALLTIEPATRGLLGLLARYGYRTVSLVALCILLAVIGSVAGLAGLAVTGVATGIGLIPALYGARRLNALGVVLVPLALAMSGMLPRVAGLLGLTPS